LFGSLLFDGFRWMTFACPPGRAHGWMAGCGRAGVVFGRNAFDGRGATPRFKWGGLVGPEPGREGKASR